MAQSGVQVSSDCINAFNDLKLGKQVKWVIFKISDSGKEIVVDEKSTDHDWEGFREKLVAAKSVDKSGKETPGPRYAVFDVEYDAPGGEGKRNKIVFIAWSPDTAGIKNKMVYSSSKEAIKRSLNGIGMEIQANSEDDIEFDSVVNRVAKGR